MTVLSCPEARAMVSDYIDGELPEPVARSLEGHLETCRNCPPLYASLVQALAAVRGLDDQRGAEELADRVIAALDDYPLPEQTTGN